MHKVARNSWFITLLSALLFNAAWLGVYTGWLIIPAMGLLYWVVKTALASCANSTIETKAKYEDALSAHPEPVEGRRPNGPRESGEIFTCNVFDILKSLKSRFSTPVGASFDKLRMSGKKITIHNRLKGAFLAASFYKQIAMRGFVWGLMIFCFHFHWLAQALVKHAGISITLTAALLVPLVSYFSLLTALWFCAMRWACMRRAWLLAPVSVAFWYLLDAYGLVLFGMRMGYPFINPCLPLMHYRWALVLLGLFMPTQPTLHDTTALVERLCFVPPVVNRAWCYGESWTRSPHAVVHRLCKQISFEREHNAVLVSPESTVLFPLNKYKALVRTLSPETNDQMVYILGSLGEKHGLVEQVAHCLQRGLIIKTYVKKILVPFAEQTPPAWQWLQGLRRRLAPGYAEGRAGGYEAGYDEPLLIAGCHVRLALCLEFFEQPVRALCCPKTDVVMALINDSWYGPLFREWLFLLGILKSHVSGRLVVYIGHFGCYTMEPKHHTITSVRSCYASLHA